MGSIIYGWMENMVGANLIDVVVNNDSDRLSFVTDKGVFVYKAHGDCCTYSWIEHIDNSIVDLSKPNEIISFTEMPIPPSFVEEAFDDLSLSNEDVHVEAYFYKLETTTGSVVIEMRNVCVGYYGGWLEFSNFIPIEETPK